MICKLDIIKRYSFSITPVLASGGVWAVGMMLLTPDSWTNYVPEELLAWGDTLEEAICEAQKLADEFISREQPEWITKQLKERGLISEA